MSDITREQAIALAERRFWEDMTPQEIAEFQLSTPWVCVPFDVFHGAIEKALGRPVWTHELAWSLDSIKDELFRGKSAPTLTEIMDLIPASKRVIVATPGDTTS